ncbi:MAG: hypothetical protein R2681_16540 [Pyrinomonadaceae bacterium]
MNVFENLVDELKEENLLEETVIDTSKERSERKPEDRENSIDIPELENSAGESLAPENADASVAEAGNKSEISEIPDHDALADPEESAPESSFSDGDAESPNDIQRNEGGDESVFTGESSDSGETDENSEEEIKTPEMIAKEAYAQRMSDEVMSLDAVEHVVSGIEREQMRTVPHRYDVVPVKQALHLFLTEFKTLESPEPTEAEATLRKEIERWHTSLIKRDADIPTPLVRLYCDDSGLNTKSLGALARFYRNSPFSENVRSKFDLVITRYFTEEAEGNRREMKLEREELIESVTKLYEEWSSVPVYSVDEEDSELILAAFKFEDYISEAKKCRTFDELLTNGFFKRIKSFKKKTSENFFAPMLIASAVECNVAIGNRYVDLVEFERKKSGADILGKRYGGKHDKSISEATSKTLQLTDLLKETESKRRREKNRGKLDALVSGFGSKEKEERDTKQFYKIAMIIFIAVGMAVTGYLTYRGIVGDTVTLTESEEKIRLERSFLHKFIKSSSIKDGTFSGSVTPKWNNLSRAEKEEVISKIAALGKVKGYEKVELKDDSGKVISSTAGAKVEFAK